MSEITQSQLKEILSYDPESGVFIKIKRTAPNDKMFRVAGCLDNKGYIRIKLLGKRYQAHRLAWLYVNGSMPKDGIDHINHIRTDNRIVNLRPATNSENQRNTTLSIRNTSGFKGVFRKGDSWVAAINIGGKPKKLGTFDNPEDAHKAYCEYASVAFGEFFCNGYTTEESPVDEVIEGRT